MPDPSTTVSELRELVAAFVAERQWQVFHNAKNLSMAIAIEAAELMEHFQWARPDELEAICSQPPTRDEIRDEIADILCFSLALANVMNLDLSDAIRQKMTKNIAKYPAEAFRGRYFKPKGG
ncbi:MAG: nucleotide pyrophosphohydrolase [Phycisphaerae bacterium]